MPVVGRTFSGLEEGRDTPKRRLGITSSLMNYGRRPPGNLTKAEKHAQLLSPVRPGMLLPMERLLSDQRRVSSNALLEDQNMRGVQKSFAASTPANFYQGGKLRPNVLKKTRRSSSITRHVQDLTKRRKFVLKLAKSLLAFGAPSHRIESQLTAASDILDAMADFVHIPNVIIVTFGDGDTGTVETHFVRANGRIALTSLHKVHLIYRKVLHDKMSVEAGTEALREILCAPPIYSLKLRYLLAFVCASIICVLAFGGSMIDMWISGFCACVLQYLGLNAATKSSMYANVYEISVSIIVSFVARALSTIPGNLFCYDAISSAGVVLILPGFTILISALELTSRNILCGSVRMVYAIIYTLFLGFGLTIGSDIYLVVNPHAHRALEYALTPKYISY
ncbi:hypothetical protein SERLA73DRAFT_128527, partial [Serpula lacrymans var. lacrymans S7.3]